ncbi:MAG: hypothetical protein NT015_12085 [Alphaproteobacteria bacterium]|nr:hypothetical protein [Alphaproteobacteria bacterium]
MDEQNELPLPATDEGPPPNLAVRRLPVPVEAPALTRSVLFRPILGRDPIAAPTEEIHADRVNQRTADINDFLRCISETATYQTFSGRFKSDTPTRGRTDGLSTQQTFYQRISKDDPGLFHIDLIVELYAEAIAITFQAHRNERNFYSEPPVPNAVASADSIHARTGAALRLLIDEDKGNDDHELAEMSFTQVDTILDVLYEQFWTEVDHTLKNAWRVMGYGETSGNYQVISEFRGVCVTTLPMEALKKRADRRIQTQERYGVAALTNPMAKSKRNDTPRDALIFINRRRGYFA